MTELTEQHQASIQEEREKAGEIARIEVSKMGLPKRIEIPAEIIGLGKKISWRYAKEREELAEDFGDQLPEIVAAAVHEFWFACWSSAASMQRGIDDKSINDNDHTRRLATAQGYADEEGWAYTFENGFAPLEPSEARKKCIKEQTGLDILDPSVAMRSMAVYWLYQASMEIEKSNIEGVLNFIHEAYDALVLDWGDWMWLQGFEFSSEFSSKKARSDLAKKAGLAAHKETHAMKAEIKDFWANNISPLISNDAAAALLMRHFPLNPRTLSRYISEFKNTSS